MTETTHRDEARLELAAAAEYRTQLADLYNAPRRDHDLIGALRQGVKFSLMAANAHASLAILEAIEDGWQPVTINVAGQVDPHSAEAIVDQLERARRAGRPVRTW
jgi:hypothetical protein